MRTEAECRLKAADCYNQAMLSQIGMQRNAYMKFANEWWCLSKLAAYQDAITQQADESLPNAPLPERR